MSPDEDLLPAERVETQLAPADNSPASILRLAVEKGIDPEAIERLAELVWKQEDRHAAQEFADALMQFQRECPEILKAKTASVATRSGSSYSYRYAPLDLIDRVVKPILQKLGLSYSWDSTLEEGMMTVTCTLRHVNGHRESSAFTCPTTSTSPGMGDAQKHASAMSFARRYSLTAVLGLTTADPDDDSMDPTPITKEQAADLHALADEVGANIVGFLAYFKVSSFGEILARDHSRAVKMLEAKRRQA